MDRTPSDIETLVPDVSRLGLDELDETEKIDSHSLRQALRRLSRDSTQAEQQLAGFQSSI